MRSAPVSFRESIREFIKKKFQQSSLDVIDVIEIPGRDRVKRMKALHEVLVALSENSEQSAGEYLVRVKQNGEANFNEFPIVRGEPLKLKLEPEIQSQRQCLGEIYLPNGKLNIPYLIKNANLLFDAGDYLSARKIYHSILKSGEFTSTVLQKLERCYEAEGKLDKALELKDILSGFRPKSSKEGTKAYIPPFPHLL